MRIREMRRLLGLSQERFAHLLGVSLQTVRRWESGLSKPLPIIRARLEELARETKAGQLAGGGSMEGAGKRGERRGEAGLGGLFKGLSGFFDLIAAMAEEGQEEAGRSGRVEALGGRLKGVYGFTVRMGLGGEPVVESFGNVRETETGPLLTETREPVTDVLDEGQEVVVIVELPGVEEREVRLAVRGDVLEVAAAGRGRRYYKEVVLPAAVDPQSIRSTYRNGILEVRVSKA